MPTECHFNNCIHQADGYCFDDECRKACVEMAECILCIDKRESDDKREIRDRDN